MRNKLEKLAIENDDKLKSQRLVSQSDNISCNKQKISDSKGFKYNNYTEVHWNKSETSNSFFFFFKELLLT